MVKAGLRRHITYPNVVATLAIFLILGGGAYAATKFNSVGTKQLKKGAVTPPKLSKSAKAAMTGPTERERRAHRGPPERPHVTVRSGYGFRCQIRRRLSLRRGGDGRWRIRSAKPRGKPSFEFRTLSRKRTGKPRPNGKSWVKTQSKNQSA